MENPLNWHGPAFLFLYAALFVAALFVSAILSRRFRPSGRPGAASDDDTLAFLAGQRPRLVETAVARLLASGALVIQGGERFLRGAGTGGGGLDRALLAVPMPASWDDFATAAKPHAEAVERRLIASGLLMDRGAARRLGLIAALPFIGLFLFGIAKLLIGLSRDKPVGILIVFLVITFVVILIRTFAVDRRTDGAVEAIASARVRHERLRRAPTVDETGRAVALFGTTVLAGSAFAALHQMRAQSDSGSGGSDGGGCGGGGGGGCGGCGGSGG
ncbi:uncharacterized protein (TIGR04222 family) [Sphingopyxis panaciterrae]|uniref:TIGR04222 domain-containing membrane protein n=1 Tax=Sphingopyxis panaciterrae TaxID=363841 RepID=UPI0014232C0F|nr:TIGR04222 domain-containing membrane protein [Sphingopyxis panaciterrae]NIJ37976.1 uncharacterized protein (TIGR04222 family) [Sphingopyxis panaciterrae]